MNNALNIVAPYRIGDYIMSLLGVWLYRQVRPDAEINLYLTPVLYALTESLGLPVNAISMTWRSRLQTWLSPVDDLIFLQSSNANLLLRSRYCRGPQNTAKLKKYNQIIFRSPEELELAEQLVRDYSTSSQIARFASYLARLPIPNAEILEAMQGFNSQRFWQDQIELRAAERGEYITICTEAAYNRRRAAGRRWGFNNFVELAEYAQKKHGLRSVFLGMDVSQPLPEVDYIIDYRCQKSLPESAELIKGSRLFIGNDSGLLHLAKFLRRPAIGVYISDHPQATGCLFSEHLTALVQPEELPYQEIDRLLG